MTDIPFRLTYVFHSCFLFETEHVAIIFDYWKDSKDDVVARFLRSTTKRVYFLCSHFHEDHFNPELLHFEVLNGEKKVLLSRDIKKFRRLSDEGVTRFLKLKEVYEDDGIKITVCGSTDIGVSFVFQADGLTVYHAGDNNNWIFPDEMDAREIKMMEGCFLATLRDMKARFDAFDVAMFPIDPRLGNEMGRGAVQFLHALPSRIFVPMHFGFSYAAAAGFSSTMAAFNSTYLPARHTGEVLVDCLS